MSDHPTEPRISESHDDVLKHMDYIQLVITRMGANSFLIKAWAVTLAAALLAFTSEKDKDTMGAWIALLPILMFWGLDAYYLRTEKTFRDLYDKVRGEHKTDFSLHISAEINKGVPPVWRFALNNILWPFYTALIFVVASVSVYGSFIRPQPPKDKVTSSTQTKTSVEETLPTQTQGKVK
jgi:hypothetical protein